MLSYVTDSTYQTRIKLFHHYRLEVHKLNTLKFHLECTAKNTVSVNTASAQSAIWRAVFCSVNSAEYRRLHR